MATETITHADLRHTLGRAWHNFITSGFADDEHPQKMRRVMFLNIFAFITILALFLFGFMNLLGTASWASPRNGMIQIASGLVDAFNGALNDINHIICKTELGTSAVRDAGFPISPVPTSADAHPNTHLPLNSTISPKNHLTL
jgi:hypothetical protein